jgi:hypothetical protein
MKVYLLYYDNDTGGREDWNTFYTPVEVFLSEAERQARIDVIKAQSEDYTDDDCFYEVDTDVMTPAQAKEWSNV